jgi:hypothetical protein
MKAEEYKDKAPTGGRKPKRFNAFSLNASSAFPKVSSYASPENKLLKYTIEKEGTTIDGIKVSPFRLSHFLNRSPFSHYRI